MACPIPYGGHN